MRYLLTALCLSALLVSCQRAPVSSFGVSADGLQAVVNNSDSGTDAERALNRLEDIDDNIQASADKVKAIGTDADTSGPANLDKLVVNDVAPEGIEFDRSLQASAIIEQKLDQKAQDLIDDKRTIETTVETSENISSERDDLNQNKLDQALDQSATDLITDSSSSDDSEQDEETPNPEASPSPEANASSL